RLAGTVGSDQAGDDSAAGGERDVVDGDQAAEADGEAVDDEVRRVGGLQRRFGGHTHRAASSTSSGTLARSACGLGLSDRSRSRRDEASHSMSERPPKRAATMARDPKTI